ncbi:hypothetical protein A3K29_04285 [Candidatus Collierbacteria bacterium RIFOXYB2_FULL_46_14]|nr:MAG: hypothetical protein A3K29_04285 [Candidatus Collierbacteria bacterium RIFOXYB2_FULL_46_14]OGD76361.1 MAG: hypothetical protein A3K43_04285 [Candidatus Collierbacteria bacterium RIFOXYA2_FULL_46_20]OGD77697.1 MAG: hypothetical protein A3K39_04285 [Candidatus Collierbacteria bacterium RIFOXYC2_FULL_43_15]OGD80987.1 MAG: hypothetical protein A2320_04780 [Pseudomonadales bacterium GWC2_63_15]OGD82419.1 MAG: hypothetical protein A3K36_04285 [Candidatus Collierbacteria bacterium RIFOXYD2_FUL
MVNINLLGKKRRESKGKNLVYIALLTPFIAFTLYFLGISMFVVLKLSWIKADQVRVDREAEAVSKEMTANNELLKKFVLAKYILGKIESLNTGKFRYKEYLDQLVGLLPEGTVLKNVDFSNKGWISVATSISGMSALRLLESNLSSAEKLSSTAFSSVFIEGVSRDKAGLYQAKLQFEITNNAGK